MTAPVALLFGVHAHQPAGNFPAVIDHAHERCYGPFLRTLADYPAFRFAVHVSGPLLDDLAARYPDDIALLRTMVGRGQVELFGGGDAEPVLASIPHRDRLRQVRALSAKLEATLGARPTGAWLTERVWESSVVPSLAEAGIRYATVDDYHFLCTGKAERDLGRHFTTEEDGQRLDLFPIAEALRYRVPFAPAQDAVAYLESLATPGRRHAAVYFDDIEKLGIWPKTYEWVYERGWLREFVERILASTVVATERFDAWHAAERTGGIVYLPTTSYIEMNEWTLPPAPAAEYEALVREEKAAGRYESRKGFLRGGIWRNFLTRYPESNWMHKRMLGVSARVDALPAAREHPALVDLLHRAQANDAYWHGLFGGLYLPHLRRGIWSSLLALEAKLDAIAPRPAVERADVDHDGSDEVFLRSAATQVVVRLDGSAAVRELASYALAQNFGDTLRRHAEHYHAKVAAGASHEKAGEGIASAHDRVAFKHDIGPADVVPDPKPRDVLRDAWIDAAGTVHELVSYREESTADGLAFACRGEGFDIGKSLRLEGDTLVARWSVAGSGVRHFRCTLDFAMPSCDGYSGRYIVGDTIPCGFGQALDLDEATGVVLDDRHLQGGVALDLVPAARVRGRPYFTVSQSEDGFERVMQSATVVVEWAVTGTTTLELRVGIRVG
jgi:4-alpha-glucanotransferase/alpha-amylase